MQCKWAREFQGVDNVTVRDGTVSLKRDAFFPDISWAAGGESVWLNGVKSPLTSLQTEHILNKTEPMETGTKAWASFLSHLLNRETHNDFGKHLIQLNKPASGLELTKAQYRVWLLQRIEKYDRQI